MNGESLSFNFRVENIEAATTKYVEMDQCLCDTNIVRYQHDSIFANSIKFEWISNWWSDWWQSVQMTFKNSLLTHSTDEIACVKLCLKSFIALIHKLDELKILSFFFFFFVSFLISFIRSLSFPDSYRFILYFYIQTKSIQPN